MMLGEGVRRARVWCLIAPSRGGVPPLGDTQSAEPTLGEPCLLYGPFPANAHPPLARGQGSLARNPIPIIRLAGCASQLPGPGCEVNDCTPSAPSAPNKGWEKDRVPTCASRILQGRSGSVP